MTFSSGVQLPYHERVADISGDEFSTIHACSRVLPRNPLVRSLVAKAGLGTSAFVPGFLSGAPAMSQQIVLIEVWVFAEQLSSLINEPPTEIRR